MSEAGRPFSVDIPGLLRALTQQFPEPLLCVRELVQNAADAESTAIHVDLSFDSERSLFRLSVQDDGRGMSAEEVEAYLTIGCSHKGPEHRGRFGIGKLSPYAMGIRRMVVETSNGEESHRLVFAADGSGTVTRGPRRAQGTSVRVYKSSDRETAQRLAQRTYELVRDHCGGLPQTLRVNGRELRDRVHQVRGRYTWRFASVSGSGTLGVQAEPVHQLSSGGILLEAGTALFGEGVSYVLDAPALAPNLSRNAVRRDQAFEAMVREARAQVARLASRIADTFRRRVDEMRAGERPVEASLDADDRAALEWLRTRIMDPEGDDGCDDAPILETADGGLTSPADLDRLGRAGERIPVSRVPRRADELRGYIDRGLPVLLLYRDVEDFLERRRLSTVEVDALDLGDEVPETQWSSAERALARAASEAESRPKRKRRSWSTVGAFSAVAVLCFTFAFAVGTYFSLGSGWKANEPGTPSVDALSASPPGVDAFRSPLDSFQSVIGLVVLLLTLGLAAGLARSLLRRSGRWSLLARAIGHPRDFIVARIWSKQGEGKRERMETGFRESSAEVEVQEEVHIDLDSPLGFVDLRSAGGDFNEARVLVVRNHRVLLNRNHPTVRHLIRIAENDVPRARILLEALVSTDPTIFRNVDPRQAEWELLARNLVWARRGR
ncbi:MAG: ATP-binding protein [Myxococcota bacterium]